MKINEYKQKVIALFRSGNATEEQWEEMTTAVSIVSERGLDKNVSAIDNLILGPFVECQCGCGTDRREHLDCV